MKLVQTFLLIPLIFTLNGCIVGTVFNPEETLKSITHEQARKPSTINSFDPAPLFYNHNINGCVPDPQKEFNYICSATINTGMLMSEPVTTYYGVKVQDGFLANNNRVSELGFDFFWGEPVHEWTKANRI